MEIVFRAAGVFVFLWLLTRAMGKRELAEMSALELVLLVVIGDLVQQAVTQEDMSLTGAALAVGTIALMVVELSYVQYRWKVARPALEGVPSVVVRDGVVLVEALSIERLTEDDVVSSAREQGIADLSKIRLGVLEPDGKFSFLRVDQDRPPEPPMGNEWSIDGALARTRFASE
jgi:uncharacterized membrane protein YcaP (DUF421 family)